MAFHLDLATPPSWVRDVEGDPVMLLGDHAHCELKAAVSAHALIAKNLTHPRLVKDLTAVVIEEMEHFELVLEELTSRGGALWEQAESEYPARLHRESASTRSNLVLDRLLIASIIEARSLERFHLLAHHGSDPGLRRFYAALLPSEAAHQGMYMRHGRELFGRDAADRRMTTLRAIEAEIMGSLPPGCAIHSGFEPTNDPVEQP